MQEASGVTSAVVEMLALLKQLRWTCPCCDFMNKSISKGFAVAAFASLSRC